MKYQGEWIVTSVSLQNFRRLQFGAVALLIVLGTFHYIVREYFASTHLQQVTRVFDVGKEDSVPTAFSILNLFISSILLYAIYTVSKFRCQRISHYWLFLCFVFLFLSIDEAASLHEKTGGLVSYIGLGSIDFHYNSWVIIGAIFTGIVFLAFLPFLFALPRRTAFLMFLSGAVFISGALGLEAVGGLMLKTGFVADRLDFIYEMRRVAEEGLEMLGIALFNCALFSHLAPATVGFHFRQHSK
ncbi:MAG TPA: hypothetical protein VKN76_06040 [Kiloniellaceae bacterium]|nr:hypothetical protein [Kiloniellaceae bacterium]